MSLIYGITPDFINTDQRGKLVQIASGGYCQINYIESRSGAIRGYHYHKLNHEAFYLIKGRIEIAAWKVNREGIADKETFEVRKYAKGDFFGINPFTAHVFTYHEDTALISFYDKGVECIDGSKDIWKVDETDFLQMKKGACS